MFYYPDSQKSPILNPYTPSSLQENVKHKVTEYVQKRSHEQALLRQAEEEAKRIREAARGEIGDVDLKRLAQRVCFLACDHVLVDLTYLNRCSTERRTINEETSFDGS